MHDFEVWRLLGTAINSPNTGTGKNSETPCGRQINAINPTPHLKMSKFHSPEPVNIISCMAKEILKMCFRIWTLRLRDYPGLSG